MSCASSVLKLYESKVGLYKKVIPRITLETKRLDNTAFIAGAKISVHYKKNKILIMIDENGEKQITSRRGKQLLDLKSKEIAKSLKDIHMVKVIVGNSTIEFTPLREAVEQKRARDKIKTKKRVYSVVDMFCSGGTLAKSFNDNPKFKIVAGIDCDDKKLITYQANFPHAETWCGDIANVEWARYKDAAIVLSTPSCRPFSNLNQTARKNNKAVEKAPEGDNTGLFIRGIEIIRPSLIMIEEVPEYKKSYSYMLLTSILIKMGYYLSETILDAQDFGSLSKRKRLCIIASIKHGFEFLPIQKILPKTIKDILEIPYNKRDWRKLENFERWSNNQRMKGRNFTTSFVNENSTKVSHPTTRYYNRQYSAVLINEDGLNDFFTPRELARIADIPDDYILPDNRNDAAFIIGDGVIYSAFSYVANCIIKHIK